MKALRIVKLILSATLFCIAIVGCDLTESEPEPAPAPPPPAAAPAPPAPEPAPPEAEEPAAPAPPAPEPAPPPAVKIGSLMDLTGELGEFGGPMDQAVRLAAEHVNAAGGVLGGRMIQIVTEDGGTSDVISVDAARKLVNVEGVSALVGPLSSGITLAIANAVTVPNQIPQISPSATAPSLTILEDDDFVFRTAPSDSFQGVVLADLAWELGYRNAAVLFINNAYGQGLADQFAESFEGLGGAVTAVAHESGQPSYASELSQVTADGPDVLIAVSYPVSAGVYIREAIDSGAADTFLFVDGSRSEDLIAAVGAEDLEGAYGTAPGAIDNEGTQRFDSEYAEYSGASGIFLRESYDAAILFALAAEAAGSDDPVAIRDALRAVSGGSGAEIGPGAAEIARALELLRNGEEINYQGASGPVDLDANGDVSGAMEIWKIEGGQIVSERTISQ